MIVVYILLGLAGLWELVEFRQKSMSKSSTPIPATPSTGISVGVSPGAVSVGTGIAEETSTDTEITTGLSSAAKATAQVPIAGQILGIAASISGLFTADHAAAVAKEAQTINQAMPTFLNEVEQTMAALNEGAITEQEAISDLQEAQSIYETTVAGIIQDDGTCFAGCILTSGNVYTWPNQSALSQFNGSSAAGGQLALKKGLATINETTHCCNSGATCNAACCLRCGIVLPTVNGLTRIINSGGGTFVVPASADNGAIQGTPSVTITYTPYVPPAATPATSGLGSSFLSSIGL